MKLALILPFLALGCTPMPDQKLGDGQTGCVTVSSVYGSVSQVVTRADNAPKGTSSSGKTRITCGSAVMEIESAVTQPPPPPANPAIGGKPALP